MEWATATWLGLGFALGLVHAFDADHVLALSVFSSRGEGASHGIRAGIRWAIGHGLVLVAVGAGLLLLGQNLSPAFTSTAEMGVGFVMIGLGAWVLVEIFRQRGHLHFHEHGQLPPHAHWHRHERDHPHPQRHEHQHEHAPLFVGGLHGLAGSAPILAVLPAAARSPMLGLAYLVLFAIGVSVAMAVVSGLLGHLSGRFSRRGNRRSLLSLRAASASGSILLGLWMVATVH